MSIYEYDEELHNKTPSVIADELEEEFDTINRICEVAKAFAPKYDVKEIIKQL